MIWRWGAFTLILMIVWQVVGVGFNLNLQQWSIGEILTGRVSTPMVRTQVPIPANLSAARPDRHYDSMVLVGDVLLARNVEYLMRTRGGQYPFEGVQLSELQINPAVVANFEAAIPLEHQPTPIGQIQFSVPESFVPYLSEAGFTHLSLANNHAYDFGSTALDHTQALIADELVHFGDPRSVPVRELSHFEISGIPISLIGINALEPIEDGSLHKLMSEATLQSEFQVVYIHWGEEYALRQNAQQREMAKRLIAYGADLIVGHHPHVVQGIELIDEVPVFYSLGNYVFDQYFSRDVQEGIILSMHFNDALQVELLPVTSRNTPSQPRHMSAQEKQLFLSKLAGKSQNELRADIEEGRLSFATKIASSEKVAMIEPLRKYVQ